MKNFIINKSHLKTALIILSGIVLIALLLLIAFGIGKLLTEHFEVLAVGGLILSIAIYYINKRFKINKEARLQNAVLGKEAINAAEQQHKINLETAENNYISVRKCIFVVLREAGASLNLIPPISMTDIDSQIRLSDNGSYVLLHYVCQKNGNVDVKVIQDVLSNKIIQKLRADEFNHLPEPFYPYEGRSYPIIMIDNIIDVGAYINIDVVICNKEYCEHLRHKAAAVNLSISTNDKDF